MSDRAAFLAAIIADPDCDTHRLVYADWLEEHGEEERAELIRVQCAIPQCGACDGVGVVQCKGVDARIDCAICHLLRWRERELLTHPNVSQWTGEGLRPFLVDHLAHRIMYGQRDLPEHPFEFRRGFVHSIISTAADWIVHADAIAWHPRQMVRQSLVYGMGGQGGEFLVARPCPETAQPVRKVTLTTWPEMGVGTWNPETSDDELVQGSLKARWPGIEFALPVAEERRRRRTP